MNMVRTKRHDNPIQQKQKTIRIQLSLSDKYKVEHERQMIVAVIAVLAMAALLVGSLASDIFPNITFVAGMAVGGLLLYIVREVYENYVVTK